VSCLSLLVLDPILDHDQAAEFGEAIAHMTASARVTVPDPDLVRE
jgi:hypothetical protein